MIEVEDTDVNIVRNFIPMRNHMPASAYGLKAISDWLNLLRVWDGCYFNFLTIKKHFISQYRTWWCLYIFLTRRNAILSKAITVIIPKVFCIGPMHLFTFSIFWFLIPCQSFIVKLLEGKLTSFSAHFLSAIKLLLNSLSAELNVPFRKEIRDRPRVNPDE